MAEDRIAEFINDMAKRYIPGKREGSDVLELVTTDTGATYRVCVTPERFLTDVGVDEPYTARIETTGDAFMQMISGRLNPLTAFMRGKVKVQGDILMLKSLPGCFSKSE